jgi:hypothetical protein
VNIYLNFGGFHKKTVLLCVAGSTLKTFRHLGESRVNFPFLRQEFLNSEIINNMGLKVDI